MPQHSLASKGEGCYAHTKSHLIRSFHNVHAIVLVRLVTKETGTDAHMHAAQCGRRATIAHAPTIPCTHAFDWKMLEHSKK